MRDVDHSLWNGYTMPLDSYGYTRIEPAFSVRSSRSALRTDAKGHRAELEWVYDEYMTVRTELALREYLSDRADARRMVGALC